VTKWETSARSHPDDLRTGELTDSYQNQCPESYGQFQDKGYTKVGEMPFNLRDFYDQTGVGFVMKENEFFDEIIYARSNSLTPNLYARNPISFKESCDQSGKSRYAAILEEIEVLMKTGFEDP
jgi:hypothetical protein